MNSLRSVKNNRVALRVLIVFGYLVFGIAGNISCALLIAPIIGMQTRHVDLYDVSIINSRNEPITLVDKWTQESARLAAHGKLTWYKSVELPGGPPVIAKTMAGTVVEPIHVQCNAPGSSVVLRYVLTY